MKVSLKWLNRCLAPADRPVDAEEADRVLTRVGFPIESVEGDLLDVEVTSNRSDCLSHLGVARELAAATGRTLIEPQINLPSTGKTAASLTQVSLDAPDLCPHYTARVITGVKVGPSPDWLVESIESIGLRSVNNIVDITNYVLMEMGQPLHTFDLNKLAGKKIVVRRANKGEAFTAIDGSKHQLTEKMLVIADAQTPVAVAGVMGGLESEVSDATTDVLLESACFEPLSVRSTSRALKLSSDSSYRFERGVDPQGIDRASQRAAALIVELAGGELAEGVVAVGSIDDQPKQVTMRGQRCRALLGEDIATDEQAEHLAKLGLSPEIEGDTITCTVPTFRLDLLREVDLIEEVARSRGFDDVPRREKIAMQVRPTQPRIVARQKLAEVLVAHGYHETITPTLTEPAHAKAFASAGDGLLQVDPQRRKADPVLRPSILASLLACRKLNQDRGNTSVRLFEVASVWAEKTGEKRTLAMLADATDPAAALRQIKSAINEMVEQLGAAVTYEPIEDARFEVAAKVLMADEDIGRVGLIANDVAEIFGLQTLVVGAEFSVGPLLASYPPKHDVSQLARFPGIERDLSIIVEETIAWQQIEQAVKDAKPAMLESLELADIYRGKPIPKGQKSISLRLCFRDPAATLRHDQVDPHIASVVESLKQGVKAELRA